MSNSIDRIERTGTNASGDYPLSTASRKRSVSNASIISQVPMNPSILEPQLEDSNVDFDENSSKISRGFSTSTQTSHTIGASPSLTNPELATAKTPKNLCEITQIIDKAIVTSLKRIIDSKHIGTETDIDEPLTRMYNVHLSQICRHLLTVQRVEGNHWHEHLMKIIGQVLQNIEPQPDLYPDMLDIRRCVKIKKIYDSKSTANFEYIDGVLFSKCLLHRQMPTHLKNPRILILRNGLEFEREADQITNLDVMISQEKDQMRRYVSQIANFKPSLVLCGGTIPTTACPHLLQRNIAAVSMVKQRVLEQIARLTDSPLISTADSLSFSHGTNSLLGRCRTMSSFSVHQHTELQRNFICLSGCNSLGCTIVIRDKNYQNLVKVKRILKWLLVLARDGEVKARYLKAFVADPFSLTVSKTHFYLQDESDRSNDDKDDDDSLMAKSLLRHRQSVTHKRDSVMFNLVRRIRHKRKLKRQVSHSHDNEFVGNDESRNLEAAFQLTSSGMLSVSSLITLPDPTKKSAIFDASPCRRYFESPLFSLLPASYTLGSKAMKCPLFPRKNLKQTFEKPLHPFITKPLISQKEIEELLISFRREGSLFEPYDHIDGNGESNDDGLSTRKNSFRDDCEEFRKSSTSNVVTCWVKPLSFWECQSLQVSVSVFSRNWRQHSLSFCYGPTLENWEMYSGNDRSLLTFLMSRCFNKDAICHHLGCGTIYSEHLRRFAANDSRVDILVRTLSQPVVAKENVKDDDPIVMWSMCRMCKAVTPLMQNASNCLSSISFSNYLHHKFYANDHLVMAFSSNNNKCTHSFEKNYIQFFAKGRLVAVVKRQKIDVYDIVIPNVYTRPDLNPYVPNTLLEKLEMASPDGENVIKTMNAYFNNLTNHLETIRQNLSSVSGASPKTLSSLRAEEILSDLKQLVTNERNEFEGNIAKISKLMEEKDRCEQEIDTQVIGIFQALAKSWFLWNERLKRVLRTLKSSEKGSPLVSEKQSSGSSASLKVLEQINDDPFAQNGTLSIQNWPKMQPSFLDYLIEPEMFRNKLKLPLEPIFPAKSHYLFHDQQLLHPVGVYDDEPSSAVAFFLATLSYQQQLTEVMCRSSMSSAVVVSQSSILTIPESVETSDPEIVSITDIEGFSATKSIAEQTGSVQTNDDKVDFSIGFRPNFLNDKKNISLEWRDESLEKESATKFTVTAYNAAVFARIRSLFFDSAKVNKQQCDNESHMFNVETSFIRSLMRCKTWKAAGGKSGSKYFKTLDGHFVMKEVSKKELQTIENFASVYLEHLQKCKDQKRPSALVPILGAFHVSIENNRGESAKYDFIVMEYLFRSHVITEKFDLKGSQRNRLVKTSTQKPSSSSEDTVEDDDMPIDNVTDEPNYDISALKNDIVLLDENFLIRNLFLLFISFVSLHFVFI